MPSHNKLRQSKFVPNLRTALAEPNKPNKTLKKRVQKSGDWARRLRPREQLIQRGSATELGIHLVRNQLRTLNSNLRKLLLAQVAPSGFGDTTHFQLSREEELLACLYELREMTLSLGFHLDLDDVTHLPIFVPVRPAIPFSHTDKNKHTLLDAKGGECGTIALLGLVNRYASALFSDHHGLLLEARIGDREPLKIYYQSMDATKNFSGGTSIRSEGALLTHTRLAPTHEVSLRGGIGFTEQFLKIYEQYPVNVIVLAEVGLQEAQSFFNSVLLGGGVIQGHWSIQSNNNDKHSGVNDITILYRSELERSYSFKVQKTVLGNAALMSDSAETCTISGCHILNAKATNKDVGKYLMNDKVAALFGDTNISTKAASSLSSGFQTVESTNSLTDGLRFSFSNSAGDKLFDKLLVRV